MIKQFNEITFSRKLFCSIALLFVMVIAKAQEIKGPNDTNPETSPNCSTSYTYVLKDPFPNVNSNWVWVADGGTVNTGQGTTTVTVTWDQEASNAGPELSVSYDNQVTGAVHLTVTPVELLPPSISNETICPGGSVTLDIGQIANWYTQQTGGTAYVAGSYTVSPTATKDYWVSRGAGECESGRTKVTVTVSTLNEGTISGVPEIYPGQQPAQINGTVGTYSNGSTTYRWEQSTTSATAGFSEITGTLGEGQNYQPGNVNVDTWYRRRLVTDCGAGYYSNVVMVNVDETVPGMSGDAAVTCTGTFTYTLQNPTVTTGWSWVADGGTIQSGQGSTSVTVIWDQVASNNGPELSVSLNNSIMGAIQKTITPTQLTPPTGISGATICPGESATLNASQTANWYDSPGDNTPYVASTYTVSPSTPGTHTYYVSFGIAECESDRTAVTVIVSDVDAGTIYAPDQIYPGQVPDPINGNTGVYSTGTLDYRWEKSTTGATSGFTSISGVTSQNYQPGSINVDTWFRRKLVTSCTADQYTAAVKVDVDENVPSLSGTTSVNCYDSYTYSLSGASQSTGWTWNPDGGRVVSGQGTTSVDVIWDQAPSVNGPEISVSQNGSVMGAIQQSVTISSSHSGGTATGQQLDVCYGTTASSLSITGSLSSGAAFQWQVRSLTDVGAEWTNISGATAATFSPGKVYQDMEYRRETTRCYTTTYSTAVSITVQSQDDAGEILGEQTIYSDEQATMLTSLVAPTTEGTVSVKWQSSTTSATTGFSDVLDGSSQPITTLTLLPPANLTQDTWFRRLLLNSCGDLPSNSLKITVQPAPNAGTITGGGTLNYDVRPANITGTNPQLAEALFQWEYSYDQEHWTPLIDQTGLNYHPPYLHRNIHYRRAMYYQGLRRYSNEVSFTVNGASGSQKPENLGTATTVTAASPMDVSSASELNFVRTFTVQLPGQTDYSTVIANTTNSEVLMATNYFDGLGRPLQSVSRGMSPLEKDLVTVTDLDEFGRNTRSFMPYVSTSTNGKFNTDAATQQGSFNGNHYTGESHFYGQAIIENSPANRPLLQSAPGKSWTGNSLGVAQHYRTNLASEGIRFWTVDNTGATNPSTTAVYSTGELTKNRSEDENGNPMVEYTDKEGRVILKQTAKVAVPSAGHTDWLNTYYLYDDYGNLRFVLPPRAVEKLYEGANNWSWTGAGIADLIFSYTYDGRNRMITKKVPGAGEVSMVYDQLDRLVLTQDANQAAIDQWSFTKYDVLSRPAMTGFITDAASRSTMQSTADSWTGMMHVEKEKLSVAGVLEADNITVSYRDTDIDVYRARTTGKIRFLPGMKSEPNAEFTTDLSASLSTDYTFYQGYHDASFPKLVDYASNFEVNTLNYYDDYEFTDKSWSTDFSGFDAAGGANHAVTPQQDSNVQGLATGSKVRVLGTDDDFLTTVMFYDDRGRVVQTQSDNHLGGEDISTTQYDFSGKVLHTYTKHSNPESSANPTTRILKEFTYDHAGRLETISEKLNDTGAFKTIVSNTYNELGELESKKLNDPTTPLETLDYDYNVRGWLKSINGDYVAGTTSNRYFGMDLSYDHGFSSSQFNGNISGVKWKSKSSNETRAYGFEYDPVNRLTAADYTQGTGSWSNSVSDFSTTYGYDANGNILNLMRKGTVAGTITTIDDLTYDYGSGYDAPGNGNQLQRVSDAAGDLGQSDFVDGNTGSSDDYQYDANGNMKDDLNKGITNITYNHLNLPETVSFGSSKTISYTYDAAGIKLQKLVNDNGSISTTDYVGGFIYEDNALQHFAHEEGRVRKNNAGNLVYDYFVKDHLGNTRMTLTEDQESLVYMATMETEYESFEEKLFLNMDDSRVVSTSANYTQDGTITADEASRLNGSDANRRVGPGKLLAVSPTDQVDIEVYAHYTGTIGTNNAIAQSTLVTAVSGAFGGAASAAVGSEARSIYELFNGNATALAVGSAGDNTQPRAYLNYILFDQDFNYVDAGFDQVTSTAKDSHEKLEIATLNISEGGYLYVYVSNESDTNFDVFFDDLRITHEKGSILQEDHYYPFGGSIAALSSSAPLSKPNKFKYNGKEEQTEFNLNWYDYGARNYDPQLGRWFNSDPLAEDFYSVSNYNYVENNPLNMIDPDGRSGEAVIDNENMKITVTSHIFFYGDVANQAYADKAVKTISDQWNGTDAKIEIDGKKYSVEFKITGEVVTEEKAEKLASENGDNVVNNFIKITNDPKERTSYMRGKDGSVYASSNSGLFTVNDLGNSSTAAHEYGHGLGWSTFGGPAGGAHEAEKRDGSEPGIMAARGTRVADKYGLVWQPAGRRTIDPDKRRVLASDVQNVLSSARGSLSRTGKAKLGVANNVIIK